MLVIYILLFALMLMYPQWLTYFIIITFAYSVFLYIQRPKQEYFQSVASGVPVSFEPSYGYLTDTISIGNPQSWSGISNPYIDTNLKGSQDPVIYQGTPMPLPHEDYPTAPVRDSMFYFKDYACKPECCLYSPYSCTNGCVCWEAPPEKTNTVIQTERTSPSS